MTLRRAVRDREWQTVLGYVLFVGLLAGGYYYNITFVQLGLLDLGTRVVGLPHSAVSTAMAALALVAVVVAVATGVAMDRRGLGRDLQAKLRLLFVVVAAQFVLTVVAPHLRSPAAFWGWILVGAAALGVAMPVTFALTVDFVAVPDRGYVAAAATGAAFFAGAALPLPWRIGTFSLVMAVAMAPVLPLLGALASGRLGVVEALADQHADPAFGVGRFCRDGPVPVRSLTFLSLLVLMFGVFFVDSLGFLRIVETPTYVGAAWQSPDLGVHLAVAGVHVVGAAMAGVLYRNFHRDWLFLWAFAVFAVTHLLYTFGIRLAPLAGDGGAVTPPLFYALAVSFYTTLNFALWPDLSTPDTVGTNTALGVGIAGFLSTFLSTAVALQFRASGVSLYDHLNLTNALALVLFLVVVVLLYARRGVAAAREAGA